MTTEPLASPVAWRTYEGIARHLLNELRARLGLRAFEVKQNVTGQSGTTWEIDAKGIRNGDEGFVIIECRGYPNGRVMQEVERSTNAIRLKFTVTGTLHDAVPAGEASTHPPNDEKAGESPRPTRSASEPKHPANATTSPTPTVPAGRRRCSDRGASSSDCFTRLMSFGS